MNLPEFICNMLGCVFLTKHWRTDVAACDLPCFQKLTDVMTGFWPSDNGSMPLDEPVCGYRGQKCSYTLEIGFGGTVLALLALFLLSFVVYRHWCVGGFGSRQSLGEFQPEQSAGQDAVADLPRRPAAHRRGAGPIAGKLLRSRRQL